MKPWVTYAIISMFFAGFTSVIAKMGLAGISGELGLAIRAAIVFVIVLLFAVWVVPAGQWSALTYNNYLWLGLSAITTSVSWIFYYKALKDGEVAVISVIDKGSMVVAILLAYFILKEQITFKTLVGSSLVIAGLLVIARR